MSEKRTGDTNSHVHQSRRITRVICIILIVLVLLLLSGSSFFFALRNVGKGSQLATNAELPTPTSTPTSTYLETPPAQSEFYDTFKNNALGWSISNTAGYYRTIESGDLMLMNSNRGTTMVEGLPTNLIVDNCKVIVDLTILKAGLTDSVGIYIRGDTNLEHDYRVDLNGNGTLDIAKEYLDSKNMPQSVILVGPKSVTALNPQGELNTIVLAMDGPKLELFINNLKVSDVDDSDYLTGQVALFAHLGKNSQDVAVSFSRVEIDKISRT